MAKILNSDAKIRLVIPTADEPQPVLILRNPSDEEIDKYRRNRTQIKRHGKIQVNYDEDVRFVDALLEGVENAEVKLNGEWEPLDPAKHDDWKQRIPRQWKQSASLYFVAGEAEVVEEKN